MSNIPTAEELLEECFISVDKSNIKSGHYFVIKETMIEFAKLHVEAALKEASEKVTLESRLYNKSQGEIKKTEDLGQEVNLVERLYLGISEKSILNSYPLTNIK